MRPEPAMTVVLEPQKASDLGHLVDALRALALEDASLMLDVDVESELPLLGGTSEHHLRDALHKLASRHPIELRTIQPTIAYRATLKGPARIDYRLCASGSGRSRFAHVVIDFEPHARGAGLSFVDETRADAMPREFILAVEEGFREMARCGTGGGAPLIDIRARLLEGGWHSKDSTRSTFLMAGMLALEEAIKKAGQLRLEPWMALEIEVPGEALGAVLDDLGARQGQVETASRHGGCCRIEAQAPLARLRDYPEALRALTRGGGRLAMRYSRHAPG